MKQVLVQFRVSEEQYTVLTKVAESQAMPVATFLRWMIFRHDAALLRLIPWTYD